MVTVIKRPQGHILNTTAKDALVTDDYGNQGALFDDPSHGLVDGDYVFVTSDIENYNGFWYVEQVNSRYFWLREYPTGSLLQWVVDGVVTYYKSDLTHGFSCVHLPIVYKLSNDRWPTNSVDTARTISNVTDSNGYCELTLSGDIKASGSAYALDYVKVLTGSLAGTYQIIAWTSDTNFVINVAYSAANDSALTSATIQYYYNNYNVRVRVFAGLSGSHYWTALKPYEQIVDLKLIPDSSGLVEVNINEFLKKQIKILSNSTLLASLPNDIDSFCQFYIQVAETYDESDGSTVSTSTPSFTDDSSSFEGAAVNSMLQFKNRYSGYLSEYIVYDSSSKFLTLFEEPRLFDGCYYDISLLNPDIFIPLFLKKEHYINGALDSTSYQEIININNNYELGLYRVPIERSYSEDRIDVSLTVYNSNTYTPGASTLTTTVTSPSSSTSDSKVLTWYLPKDVAPVLTYTYSLFVAAPYTSGDVASVSLTYNHYDGTSTVVYSQALASVSSSSGGPIAFPTPTKDVISIRLNASVSNAGSSNDKNATLTISELSEGYSGQFSETKTINIDTECSFQDIYLTWKNYLGGMDYWKFTAQKDYIADVTGTTESSKNIYPTWPKSYGEFADIIQGETSRDSRDGIVVRSQNVTESEMNAIRYIVSSPLVQILVSKSDRRTVIVSPGSFTWKRDEDKLYNIEFEIKYTNMIPSQSL